MTFVTDGQNGIHKNITVRELTCESLFLGNCVPNLTSFSGILSRVVSFGLSNRYVD